MLTTKQISEMLRVSEETVRRWIRTGELKAEQNGKSYLVEKNDLLKLVQQKSKISTTSIGKMASIIPIIGEAGVAAGGTMIGKVLKKLNSKESIESVVTQNTEKPSIHEIEAIIESLIRKKKRLELEHQMRLLEVDEEIAKYHKIKNNL
ncbi:helix-turn-helix domain-containing protein [Priestia megaterium]|uniref:helix-turn-helix domain-containing protein n=1 Tax=Priestia megaterium TaxID=1404 RepID=UPI0011A66A18|nr:helix-turn-helix domain-containing protein [Priestia megaterium]